MAFLSPMFSRPSISKSSLQIIFSHQIFTMPQIFATLSLTAGLKTMEPIRKKLIKNVDREKQSQNRTARKYKSGLEGRLISFKVGVIVCWLNCLRLIIYCNRDKSAACKNRALICFRRAMRLFLTASSSAITMT